LNWCTVCFYEIMKCCIKLYNFGKEQKRSFLHFSLLNQKLNKEIKVLKEFLSKKGNDSIKND